MKYFHFTNFAPVEIEKVLTWKLPMAMAEYDNGNKKPLIDYMRNNATTELLHNGYYRLGGWQFSIKEYCKKYWVKVKYYGIIEVYSPDRTTIRNVYGKHNVLQIMEV